MITQVRTKISIGVKVALVVAVIVYVALAILWLYFFPAEEMVEGLSNIFSRLKSR